MPVHWLGHWPRRRLHPRDPPGVGCEHQDRLERRRRLVARATPSRACASLTCPRSLHAINPPLNPHHPRACRGDHRHCRGLPAGCLHDPDQGAGGDDVWRRCAVVGGAASLLSASPRSPFPPLPFLSSCYSALAALSPDAACAPAHPVVNIPSAGRHPWRFAAPCPTLLSSLLSPALSFSLLLPLLCLSLSCINTKVKQVDPDTQYLHKQTSLIRNKTTEKKQKELESKH